MDDILNATAGSPAVYFEGDELVLHEFRETAPDVIRLVREALDAAAMVHRLLELGARLVTTAGTTLDEELVRKEFDRLTAEFGAKVDEATSVLSDRTEDVLGDSGQLQTVLEGFRTELDAALARLFDEESRNSVLGRFDALMQQVGESQLRQFRRVVDPDDEDSPLRRHRADIVRAVEEHSKRLSDAIQDLSEKVVAQHVEESALEAAAKKGFAFEDIVYAAVAEAVTPYGDLAESVGRTIGATGSAVGDLLVTVNADDTVGCVGRYVLEVKDRHINLRDILAELDEALANREADVAIAVFSSERTAPTPVTFHYYGNKAVVVLDKSAPDPRALQLACMWARVVVRQKVAHEAEGFDAKAALDAVKDAILALDRVTAVRRFHTEAKNKIDQAGKQVDDMVCEVDRELGRLRSLVVRDAE